MKEDTIFEVNSIHYLIDDLLVVNEEVFTDVFYNSKDVDVKYHTRIQSDMAYTSFFDLPSILLDGETNLKDLRIKLPKVNIHGEVTGYSEGYYPFAAGQRLIWSDDISFNHSLVVPAYSAYGLKVYNQTSQVTSTFTCKLLKKGTGMILEVIGKWHASQFMKQVIVVTDEQGNQVDSINRYIYRLDY